MATVETYRGVPITLHPEYGTYNADCPKTGRTMADGCNSLQDARELIDWHAKVTEDFRKAEIAYAAKIQRWCNAPQDDTPSLDAPWWRTER